MRKTDTPSKMNALLLALAAHGLLILIASLFVVTKEVETDFLQVEWVKLPRTMRRIKTMEVKPVQPRVIKPKALSTHRVTPTAKPLDVKAAAARSVSIVEDSMDLSLDAPEAGAIGEVKTDTEQAVVSHNTMLTRGAGDAGGYRIGTSKFAYQKGIHIGTRLAVVYNRKDYLCAMETAEVDSRASLRSRRSPDVHRFMTNLLVYTMKYGGNTDRTNYRR